MLSIRKERYREETERGERKKEREKARGFNDILFLSGILLNFNFQIFNLEPG